MNISSINTANRVDISEVSKETSMNALNKSTLRSLTVENALADKLKSLKDYATSLVSSASSQSLNIDERLRTIMDEPYIDDCMMRYGNEAVLHKLERESHALEDRCIALKQEIEKKIPAGAERDLALAKVNKFFEKSQASSNKAIDEVKERIRVHGNEENVRKSSGAWGKRPVMGVEDSIGISILSRNGRSEILKHFQQAQYELQSANVSRTIDDKALSASSLEKLSNPQLDEILAKVTVTNRLSDRLSSLG